MVVIVDYGAGNIRSVFNAFSLLGAETKISRAQEEILSASHIVLPGVGSFSTCVQMLRTRGLDSILSKAVLKEKRPFLGICVGLQMLATTGVEGGISHGLNWIPGVVNKLAPPDTFVLPHVGWNTLKIVRPHPVLRGLDRKDFYFTHSYGLVCSNSNDIIATTDYGVEITAAAGKDNIFATQFHPEKSSDNGIKLLENFLEWAP